MQTTYFIFEILHYAIKYKILKLLLSYLAVMISCLQTVRPYCLLYKAKDPNINIITNFFGKLLVFVINLENVGKVGRLSHFL